MDYQTVNDKKFSVIRAGEIASILVERIISARITKCTDISDSDIHVENLDILRNKFVMYVIRKYRESSDFGNAVSIALSTGDVKEVLSERCKVMDPQKIVILPAAAVPTWVYERLLSKRNPMIGIYAWYQSCRRSSVRVQSRIASVSMSRIGTCRLPICLTCPTRHLNAAMSRSEISNPIYQALNTANLQL